MKRSLLLSILSIFLLLASTLPGLSWLTYFAFAPLFILISETSFLQSILWTSLIVFVYLVVLAYPIRLFSGEAYAGVVVFSTLAFMLPVSTLRFIWYRLGKPRLRIVLPTCVFVAFNFLVERLRLGPVLTLPVATQPLIVLQLLSISASSAVLALVLLANGVVAELFTKGRHIHRAALIVYAGLFVAAGIYGTARLLQPLPPPTVPIALIQHNLPIERAGGKGEANKILNCYLNLAHKAVQEECDLVIFPQYDITTDADLERNKLAQTAAEVQKWILLGTYLPLQTGKGVEEEEYNVALLLPPGGQQAEMYRASFPPPFRHVRQRLGKNEGPIPTPWGKAGILLCFEDTSTHLARQWVNKGAGILIALSNPGHFRKSWVAHFYFLLDRMRAIETARYLIRCSPNGFSGVIDPFGRIVAKSRLDEERILFAKVAWRDEKTSYVRYGDWLGLGCLIFVISMTASLISSRKRG